MMQTEEEFLAVLEEHLPEDLTAEQIDALHAAVQGSRRLREAILESIGFEEAVAASYAPEPLEVGELIRRYRDRARQQRRGRWRSVAWSVLAIVAVSTVSMGVWAIVQRLGSEPAPVAERPPAADRRELGPRSQPADTNTDTDRDREGVNAGEDLVSLTDATPATTEGTVIEPPEPLPDFEPSWRLYDDRAARGDRTWENELHKVLLPVGTSFMKHIPSKLNRYGEVEAGRFLLDGTFVAVPPKPDGRRVRLCVAQPRDRYDGPRRVQWYFWPKDGQDGVLIRWHAPSRSLRAFSVHRDKVPQEAPRFSSKATGLDWLRGDAVTRTDPNIDFTWDEQGLPMKEIGSGRVLARWRGSIRFPGGGEWKFAVTTKGSVSIHLDGEHVFPRQVNSRSKTSVSKTVNVGTYFKRENRKPIVRDIQIQYLGCPQGDGLRLEWERSLADGREPAWHRDAIARHVVPPEAFVAGDGEEGKPAGLAATYYYPSGDDAFGSITEGHIIATDNGLWQETLGGGSLDVLYASGAVRLVKGDIELLAAAMPPPDQFVIDAQAELHYAEVLRLHPLEEYGDLAGCSVATSVHPLDASQWSEGREPAEAGMEVRSVDDGIEFSRGDSQERPVALLALEAPMGCEITARIDKASTGTGVLLRHPAADRSSFRLMVAEHNGRRVLCTGLRDDRVVRESFDRGWFVGDRFWIRSAVGLDYVRMDFSNDGVSWITAEAGSFSSITPVGKQFHIGVCVAAGSGTRVLRLGELQVRRLHGLEDLAEGAAFSSACEKLESAKDWQASFPSILGEPIDGVTLPEWAVACHLAALHQEAPVAARKRFAIELLRAAVRANVPWERLRPALIELPRRMSVYDPGFTRGELAALYQDMARHFWKFGRRDELAGLVDAWYEQQGQSMGRLEGLRLPGSLARLCLSGMAIENDWDNLWMRALRENFYSKSGWYRRDSRDRRDPLAEWLLRMAANARKAEDPSGAGLVQSWQDRRTRTSAAKHPLVAKDRSREMESTLQEVRGAVEAQQWDLAAAAVLRLPVGEGLAATSPDDTLLITSHVAVRQLLEGHAPLVEAMNEHQRVGRMRVARGMKYGEIDLVESVASRFYGTEVGWTAMSLLADRDLSQGEFLRAVKRYRELAQMDNFVQDEEFQAKYQIAAAMNGQPMGTAIDKPVTLGDREYSAERFNEILRQAAPNGGPCDLLDHGAVQSLAPVGSEWDCAHVLPLTVPPNDQGTGAVFIPSLGERYASAVHDSSKLGWASDNGRLFLHQQGRLTAIDTANGKVVFEATEEVKSNKEPRNAEAHPLVYGEHVIVPFYWGTRSELTCFNKNTGAVVWHRPFDDAVIGSPTSIDGALLALSVKRYQLGYGDVILRRIDPKTGSSVLARPIARLHLGNALFDVARVVRHGERILVRIGCSVICCDFLGDVQWVAPLPHIPEGVRSSLLDIDGHGYRGGDSDLVVIDDCVVASAPNSWNIECRDIRSGKLVWRYQDPAVRRVVGRSGERLIVVAGGELLALDTATGRIVWSRAFADVTGKADAQRRSDAEGNVIIDEGGDILLVGPNSADGGMSIWRVRGVDGQLLSPLEVKGTPIKPAKVARTFGDGQRLYRLGYDGENTLSLQVLETEDN